MSLSQNTGHVESGHAPEDKKTQDKNAANCGNNGNTEAVASAGTADADNIDRKTGDIVTELRALLGQDVVLLPIPLRKKGPVIRDWQKITVDVMGDAAYVEQLRRENIGVLLGAASGDLCAIDIDVDDEVEPFLVLNPPLRTTLRTRGARGAQIWIRLQGNYPAFAKLKMEDRADWGEWRCNGNQSVIHGLHKETGHPYQRLVDAPPIGMRFDQIVWPDYLKLPWAKDDFDVLVESDGEPFTVSDSGGVVLNQMFFIRKFMLEHRIIFDANLGEFFQYEQIDGLWKRRTPESIKRSLNEDLTHTAKESGHHAIFAKRTSGLLEGLVTLLRCAAEKSDVFAARPESIHVSNGMICFEGSEVVLRSFHPDFLSRNQCPYAFQLEAECSRFKNELLGCALGEDDIKLMQKWAGGVLLGRNPTQRILLMLGTPGGGKSTLMDILERTIGLQNVSQLRTEHLGDRFELSGFTGRTLLTGKDVAASFLMSKGAYVMKALVGGDLLEAEKKGFNQRLHLRGDFNIGITCNADLNIRLEGDVNAWRRRLLVVKYERPAPSKPIPGFAEQLLAEEGPGILRWMVEGAIELLNDIDEQGSFILTDGQKARIDRLMDQSDSTRRFVQEGVGVRKGAVITATNLLTAYYEFCETRGWHPMSTREVYAQLPKHMLEIHKVHKRHDLGDNGSIRGYKHVALITPVGGAHHEN